MFLGQAGPPGDPLTCSDGCIIRESVPGPPSPGLPCIRPSSAGADRSPGSAVAWHKAGGENLLSRPGAGMSQAQKDACRRCLLPQRVLGLNLEPEVEPAEECVCGPGRMRQAGFCHLCLAQTHGVLPTSQPPLPSAAQAGFEARPQTAPIFFFPLCLVEPGILISPCGRRTPTVTVLPSPLPL